MRRLNRLQTGIVLFALGFAFWGTFATTLHVSDYNAIAAFLVSSIAAIIGSWFLVRSTQKDVVTDLRVRHRAWIAMTVSSAILLMLAALLATLTPMTIPIIDRFPGLVRLTFRYDWFLPTFGLVAILVQPFLMIFTLYPILVGRERKMLGLAGGITVLTLIVEVFTTQLFSIFWVGGLGTTTILVVFAFLLPLIDPDRTGTPSSLMGLPVEATGGQPANPRFDDSPDE